MADWEALKGKAGSAAEQLFLWGLLSQLMSALAAPLLTELQTTVNSAAPVTPLSAAEVATAVNRAFMDAAAGEAEAAKQGIDTARFGVMRDLAGTAPAPQQLAEALRRHAIPDKGTGRDSVSFEQGIREGNLLDKWAPVIQAISMAIPSPADIVDAILKGQVTAAQGEADFTEVGGDPKWLQLLVDIAGNPPSPTELLSLAMRGIIPWNGTGPAETTFQQGFYEGRSKDKWQPIYRHLSEWYPTVSEALELYRYGQIDQAEAIAKMATRGVNAQDAAAWIGYADANAVTDYRGLTESAILGMLSISYITDAQAREMLKAIHKGPAAIDQLIAYGHIQRAIQSVNQAVSRVGSLYEARKITQATATDALTRIGVQAIAIPGIIADWDAVASINVKTLTESQVADAWKYQVITQEEAMTELTNIGYTPFDAWVVLSVKAKTALPGRPQPGPGPSIGTVVPGTT